MTSLALEALRLCDGVAPLGNSTSGERTQASEDRTGIGGRSDPWRSRWYSLEITRAEWPWILERGEKPARVISTTEALAVLMGLKLFVPRRRCTTFTCENPDDKVVH